MEEGQVACVGVPGLWTATVVGVCDKAARDASISCWKGVDVGIGGSIAGTG